MTTASNNIRMSTILIRKWERSYYKTREGEREGEREVDLHVCVFHSHCFPKCVRDDK